MRAWTARKRKERRCSATRTARSTKMAAKAKMISSGQKWGSQSLRGSQGDQSGYWCNLMPSIVNAKPMTSATAGPRYVFSRHQRRSNWPGTRCLLRPSLVRSQTIRRIGVPKIRSVHSVWNSAESIGTPALQVVDRRPGGFARPSYSVSGHHRRSERASSLAC